MSTIDRRFHDKSHLRLLLRWRWLVLAIAIPISLVIEMLEGNTNGLLFLDEVVIDGMVLPLTTWVVLTFAARKITQQFEHAEALEQRQRFIQRLAEHRDYNDLAVFIVRFPATLLPIDHASLFIFDHDQSRLNFVTEWNAAGIANSPTPRYVTTMAHCQVCRLSNPPKPGHNGLCPLMVEQSTGSSPREYCLPLSHDTKLIGVLRMRCQPDKVPTSSQIEFITALLPEMALSLELAHGDYRQAQQLLRQAQIQERRRITHELHDSLAQQMFYLHLGLDQLASNASQLMNDGVQHKVESMRDVAADVYEQVRNNLSILRAWEQTDITEAISRLARVTAHNANLTIDFTVQGEAQWLSPHTCEDIYGAVRESLNNVVKHARAERVQLDLLWSAEYLRITLVDDGVGFDPAHHPREGHYGLMLMREVLDAQQGVVTLDSRPGNGTSVQIRIPLQQPDHALGMPNLVTEAAPLRDLAVQGV